MSRNTPFNRDPQGSASPPNSPFLTSHFSLLTSSLWLAGRFLFPCDDQRRADDPNWPAAGRWFVLWGLAIGVVYAVVFRAAWRWFGEYEYIRWLPAVAVLTVDLGFCGYRLLVGAADVASRRHSCEASNAPLATPPALVAIVLVALAKYAMLVSLPLGRLEQPSTIGWDQSGGAGWLGFLRPGAIYRPLILMPIWGRWAVTLALSIGRAAPDSSARLQDMARGSRLWVILALWLAVTALTAWYCGRSWVELPYGLALTLGVTTVSYLAAFILARRAGGQSEATVAGAGLVAEIAFLALYLPIARYMYWY
jgi:hypothetical protein